MERHGETRNKPKTVGAETAIVYGTDRMTVPGQRRIDTMFAQADKLMQSAEAAKRTAVMSR